MTNKLDSEWIDVIIVYVEFINEKKINKEVEATRPSDALAAEARIRAAEEEVIISPKSGTTSPTVQVNKRRMQKPPSPARRSELLRASLNGFRPLEHLLPHDFKNVFPHRQLVILDRHFQARVDVVNAEARAPR